MQTVALVLAYLVCAGHGWRVQSAAQRLRSTAGKRQLDRERVQIASSLDPSNRLARLLLGIDLAAAPVQGIRSSEARMTAAAESTREAEVDSWLVRAASASPPPSSLLESVREAAAKELPSLRFPQSRDEAWRRFDLSLLRKASVITPAPASTDVLKALLAECSNATAAT